VAMRPLLPAQSGGHVQIQGIERPTAHVHVNRRIARGQSRSERPPVPIQLVSGRDDGNHDLVTQLLVVDIAEDNVRIGICGPLDDFGCLVDLVESQVRTACDIEQDALGTLNAHIQQRAVNGLLRGVLGTIVAAGGADGHQR